MKKIIALLLLLLSLTLISGCGAENTESIVSEKAPVVINVPSDTSKEATAQTPKHSSSAETPSFSTQQSVKVDGQNYSYCGNKNSKKFHKSSCSSLKNTKDENKVYLKDRSDYINQGFVPCKRCNP